MTTYLILARNIFFLYSGCDHQNHTLIVNSMAHLMILILFLKTLSKAGGASRMAVGAYLQTGI